ncbi:unnamed protein product [Heterotrigona itama]|uniref:Uncharacterized protein n=1 Tax=Heterotrigona itama TaxID=395501 RepID=A0A6V7HAM5_9HYME|nr:unnamed protein product [Heterotrigona itama]
MQRLSINKGHAFILVYSVCSRQSLEELRPIWAVIRELKGQNISQIPIMLVGNKCDESPSVREVSMSEGAAEAANWGCGFLETSAKMDHNVKELFQDLLLLEKSRPVSLQPVESNNAISLKEKCCVIADTQLSPSPRFHQTNDAYAFFILYQSARYNSRIIVTQHSDHPLELYQAYIYTIQEGTPSFWPTTADSDQEPI